MKMFNLLKRNHSLRRFTIMVFFGWLFLLFTSGMIYIYVSHETRGHEVDEAIAHYESVFENYNNKILLISSYFTEHTLHMTEEEYLLFVDSVLEGDSSFESITVAPQGVIQYIYPQSEYDELIDIDILSSGDIANTQAMLDAIDTHEIFYQYSKNEDDSRVTGIYIRKAMFIENEFYGFITLTIDSEVFSNESFIFSSDIIEIALFSDDDTIIYGIGDYEKFMIHEVDTSYITVQIGERLRADFLASIRSYEVGFILTITLMVSILLMIVYRDKQTQVELEEELHFRKNYDKDTNLFNVDRLYSDLQGHIDSKSIFYLAFVNINNVKFIDEKFGHELANDLFRKTTQMITRVLRQNSTLYRYGGDEYVIVTLTDSISEEKNMLRRVVKIFENDIVFGNIRARLGVQIGITMYPTNGYTVEGLIKNAHLISTQVNNYNKEGFLFYQKDLIANTSFNEDFDKMVSTLNPELFEVYLMPIIDVQTNIISGFECLTRVFNDLGKKLNTEEVVLSLERNGKIQYLDEIVFSKMLLLMKKINKEFPDEEYFLSLNASALSLNDEYVNRVITLYKNARIKKGTIVLELTESYQVEDYEYLIHLFRQLNESGIKIAIDDFGSGYSSLSYISKFPIYAIKVDKEYVRDYRDNEFHKTLLMTLKSIAEVLKCKLVAEGVDSPETLDFLKEFGCPFYQGYLFSKGLPYEDAVALVKNNIRKYCKVKDND